MISQAHEAPLSRLTVFRGEAGSCIVVWTFHHIVLDCRSALMVLQEALALCRGATFPALERAQFSSIVEAMEQHRASSNAYWQRTLPGPLNAGALKVRKTEDVVGATLFFCSSGSEFITGQTIVIDGGQYFH